jgi:uncharacterized protein (DUF4415 family)
MGGKRTEGRSRTDWAQIDAMKDADIHYPDVPKLGSEFFAKAIRWPRAKKQTTVRFDPDVLAFFRKHSNRYQPTINAAFRKYVETHKRRAG